MRPVIRRVADAALLLWLVLTLTFLLLHAAPGDPATFLVSPSASPAEVARMRRALGLDAPLLVQYARWAGSLLQGNMGASFVQRAPVTTVLGHALPISLWLGLISLALTFVIGIAVGAYQAAQRGRATDTTLTVITTALYAAPSFWLALALVAVFTYGAAEWGLPAALRLPAFGVHDPAGAPPGIAGVGDLVRHALLPVLTLTAIGAAGVARYARTIIADLVSVPFVRTAVAKGLTPHAVYARHVLRNALPPLIVLLALALPGVLAGSVFVETVFAWPGVGQLMVASIRARDYPVVLGATALYGAMVIIANLVGDVALPIVDPRRRA